MTKQAIQTVHAPEAIGPYSQAIRVDHLLFLSGQIGINPETKRVVEGGVEPQTHQIFKNIKAILAEAGSDIDQVVKVTIYPQGHVQLQTDQFHLCPEFLGTVPRPFRRCRQGTAAGGGH